MTITTSKTLPATKELAEILKQEFSGIYTYRLFGMGEEKSIIVKKSTFVGAQISKTENEISIDWTPPSVSAGYFLAFMDFIGGGIILAWLFGAQVKKLEKKIAAFLNHKYN